MLAVALLPVYVEMYWEDSYELLTGVWSQQM
jgi:hypothetical protein